MIELFDKYVRWKILAHFFENPNTEFYLKQLARELGISPGSVFESFKDFEKEGVLILDKKGQNHFYHLNLEYPGIQFLKHGYGVALILSADPVKKFIENDHNLLSLVLYGSFADGTFDERSDVDLLIITPTTDAKYGEIVKEIELKVRRTVNVTCFKLGAWQRLMEKRDAFHRSIVRNHIMLYGSEIG